MTYQHNKHYFGATCDVLDIIADALAKGSRRVEVEAPTARGRLRVTVEWPDAAPTEGAP